MIPLFAVPDAGRVRAVKLWLKVIMGNPKLPNDPAMFSTVTGAVSVFSTIKVNVKYRSRNDEGYNSYRRSPCLL